MTMLIRTVKTTRELVADIASLLAGQAGCENDGVAPTYEDYSTAAGHCLDWSRAYGWGNFSEYANYLLEQCVGTVEKDQRAAEREQIEFQWAPTKLLPIIE